MAQTIELPLAGGGTILFEVDEASDRNTRRGAGESVLPIATETFESVIGRLKPVAEALASELSSLARVPDSVAVEFGVKLNANAGVVIAKGGSEASLKITLSWKKAG